MQVLEIEASPQKPEVYFNASTGVLKIVGKSYPSDAIDFFDPLLNWVEKYVLQPASKTELICEIEYLNSTSQKKLIDLMYLLKTLHDGGKQLTVVWKYEEGDDDILSVGELVEHELKIPFRYEEMEF